MPYAGQIKKGDTTRFNVRGEMIAVIVDRVGWDTLTVTSLDLRFKWHDVPKSKWIQQKQILGDLEKEA